MAKFWPNFTCNLAKFTDFSVAALKSMDSSTDDDEKLKGAYSIEDMLGALSEDGRDVSSMSKRKAELFVNEGFVMIEREIG